MQNNSTLVDFQIKDLVKQGVLLLPDPEAVDDMATSPIQPSSYDPRVGTKMWLMDASRRPMPWETINDLIKKYSQKELDLQDGAILFKDNVYIVELQEGLVINSPFLRVRGNSKSSTGRVDVQTRILTDGNPHYDNIQGPFQGKLYLEVVSNSFNIKLQTGTALNQIRFSTGEPRMSDDELRSLLFSHQIMYTADGKPIPYNEVLVDNGIVFSVNLTSDIIAYKAKPTGLVVDLQDIGGHDVEPYWEAIPASDNRELPLEPGDFILPSTFEGIATPTHVAGELAQVDPKSGHYTSHYAGFFDAGFGMKEGNPGPQGNTTTLEVRAHFRKEVFRHRQRIAVLVLERLSAIPQFPYGKAGKSNYTEQSGPRLSKYFKKPLQGINNSPESHSFS